MIGKIKSNPWIRQGLYKFLLSKTAVRKMTDYPLTLTFPAAQHFNLFFSRSIRYEPDDMNYIQRYLTPDGVCFDVGANIGIYSLVAAHTVGPSGQVYAFEPDPQNWHWLQKNVEQNNLQQISIHPHALGRESSTTTLFQDTTTSRTSSLVKDAWSPDSIARQPVQVDVLPLDDYASKIRRLDFLKIDVESYEYEVLLGATKLLTQFKPALLIELSSRHKEETRELLQQLGYLHHDGVQNSSMHLYTHQEGLTSA